MPHYHSAMAELDRARVELVAPIAPQAPLPPSRIIYLQERVIRILVRNGGMMFNARSMPSRKTMRGNDVLALRGGFGLVVMILLQITIISCKSGNDNLPVDRSFLTQQPCASPCWYGLEPDKSSTSDVHATLATLPFVDQSRIAEGRRTWLKDDNAKEIDFDCVNPKGDSCGGMFTFSQGTLKWLLLRIPYQLTFQMAAD